MTGKDVVKMAFNLEAPPRLPVTLIGGGVWAIHMAGETFAEIKDNPERIAEIYIQVFRNAGSDCLLLSSFGNHPIHLLGCPITDNSSDPPALSGSVIQSLDDIDSLDMEKVRNNQMMQSFIHSHHLVAEAIGDEICVMASQWAPFTCSAKILGIDATMSAAVEAPDRLLDLIRFATEFSWSYIEPVLEYKNVSGVFLGEPLGSGDLISPENFSMFSAPFLKDIVSRIKAKGKYAIVHICGNTTRILDDVVDIGPTCFSLDTKVDLKKAREVLSGKICVAGHISRTGVFFSGTPDEVISVGKACVEAWGEGGGYILTLECDFPKDVPLENIQALMSLKEN